MRDYWASLSPGEREERLANTHRPEVYAETSKSVRRYWNNLTSVEKEVLLSKSIHSESSLHRVRDEESERGRVEALRSYYRNNPEAGNRISRTLRERFRNMPVEERQERSRKSFNSDEANRKSAESTRRYWANRTEEERRQLTKHLRDASVRERAADSVRDLFAGMPEGERKERARMSFASPEAILKSARTNARPPSEPEWFMGLYLERNFPGEWVYNGDGNRGIIIGGRIPDFVNRDKKMVGEVFGEYWHDRNYFPNTMTPEQRIGHYRKFGYECIVVWDYECYLQGDLDVRFKLGTKKVGGYKGDAA